MAYFSTLVYLLASFILALIIVVMGGTPDLHSSPAFLLQTWGYVVRRDFPTAVTAHGIFLPLAAGIYRLIRAEAYRANV